MRQVSSSEARQEEVESFEARDDEGGAFNRGTQPEAQQAQRLRTHRHRRQQYGRHRQRVGDTATLVKPDKPKTNMRGRRVPNSEKKPWKNGRKWFSFGRKKAATTGENGQQTKSGQHNIPVRAKVPTAESIEVVLCPPRNGKRIVKIATPKTPVVV